MTQKRILVVDDEVAILLAFKKLLTREHISIDTAETMEDAETLLKQRSYDVVIADLRLTGVLGKEGLELIKYVKENTPSTKVILATGYGSPEIMEEAYRLGAEYYFEKPVSSELILKAMSDMGAL